MLFYTKNLLNSFIDSGFLIQNDWTTADILTKQKKGTPGQLWQCLYITYTEETLEVYLFSISYKTNIAGFILHLERLLSSECDEKCKQKNFLLNLKKRMPGQIACVFLDLPVFLLIACVIGDCQNWFDEIHLLILHDSSLKRFQGKVSNSSSIFSYVCMIQHLKSFSKFVHIIRLIVRSKYKGV